MTFAYTQKTSVRPLQVRRSLLAAGVPGIPEQVPGLVVWLRADDIAGFYDNGDIVPSWPNMAEPEMFNGPPGTFATGLLNGRPGVQLDAFSEHLDGTVARTLKPATFFLVARWGTVSGNRVPIGNVSGNSALILDSNGTSLRLVQEGTATVGTASTAIAAGTPYVIDASYSASGEFLFGRNGVDDGSGTNNLAISPSAICVGARDSAGGFGGDVFELLVYDNVVSSADRAILRNYLLVSWGI